MWGHAVSQGLRPPPQLPRRVCAPPSPGPHSRAAAAAPGGDTGPSAGAGSAPARSTSRTYAARGRGLSAGWVLGRGPPPTAPSGISTGPSPRPCTTGTEPKGGLCPPPGPGPSLGTQQPPGAHLQHSLALVLAGAAGGREGGIWGPLQGKRAAAPTPFPGTAWDKSAGAPAPSPGGGGCPVPHVPPRSPVTHAWSWGCSGAGVRLGWQLSCSHRSHYSSPSCHLLTLLSGASRQLCSAPSPAFINAHSRQAGAAAGGGGDLQHGRAAPRLGRVPCCPAAGCTGSVLSLSLSLLPPKGQRLGGTPHSPLLLEAQRDVLVVAEVVGAGVVEGAVGEPHGVAPDCVWGEGGGSQPAPGTGALHAAGSWHRHALAPRPPEAPRPCAHPRRWAASPGRGRGTGRTPGSSSLHLWARGKRCSGLSPAPPDPGGSPTAPRPPPCCRGGRQHCQKPGALGQPQGPAAVPRFTQPRPCSRRPSDLLPLSLPTFWGAGPTPCAAQARLHPAVTAPGAPPPPPAAAAS